MRRNRIAGRLLLQLYCTVYEVLSECVLSITIFAFSVFHSWMLIIDQPERLDGNNSKRGSSTVGYLFDGN